MRPVVVLQDATADSDARRDETRRDKTRQDEMQSAVPRAWDRSCITVTLSTLEVATGRSVLKPHGPLNLIEPRVTTSPVAVVLWGSCLGALALSGTLAHSCHSFMLFYSHSFIISHALDMQRCQESDMR